MILKKRNIKKKSIFDKIGKHFIPNPYPEIDFLNSTITYFICVYIYFITESDFQMVFFYKLIGSISGGAFFWMFPSLISNGIGNFIKNKLFRFLVKYYLFLIVLEKQFSILGSPVALAAAVKTKYFLFFGLDILFKKIFNSPRPSGWAFLKFKKTLK
jgi:hypothetical protein